MEECECCYLRDLKILALSHLMNNFGVCNFTEFFFFINKVTNVKCSDYGNCPFVIFIKAGLLSCFCTLRNLFRLNG